jgi:diguanylate cyclase (GGDEF)-like protein/PAS domain S-box-containing protein
VPGPYTIGVLTPWSNGFFYGAVIAGIVRESAAAGGRVVVVQTVEPSRETDDVVSSPDFTAPAAWGHIDGAICITSPGERVLRELQDRDIPFVLACVAVDDGAVSSAVADNVGGTRLAIEHLLEHGHTRIGFVGNLVQSDMQERYASYRETLRAHGIEPDPDLYFSPPNNVVWGGQVAGEEILRTRPSMTAVFVATDHNAFGVMEVLSRAGLRIPEDLAVIGFDDVEQAAFASPELTSVSQPFGRIGSLAATLLHQKLDGDIVAPGTHTTASHLAVRESCGCRVTLADATPEALRPTESPESVLVTEFASILLPSAAPGVTLQHLSARVRRLADEVGAVLRSDGAVPGSALDRAVIGVAPSGTAPEILRRLLAAITVFVSRSVCDLPAGTATAERATQTIARIDAAIWHQHTRSYLDRDVAHERSRGEQYRIGTKLIDLKNADPLALSWLAETHVAVGTLGLWDGDAQTRLRIESTYDANGVVPDIVGSMCRVEDFPPRALIDAADPSLDEVAFVIPVQTSSRSRGLLAVVGTLDMVAMSGHQAYGYWASLLTVALEQRDMLASVKQSEGRLALAIEATRDGMWDWDLTTDTVFYSPRCREMLGITDPAEDRPNAWWAAVHPEDLDRLRLMLAGGQGEAREIIELEHRLRGIDGTYRWTLCLALPAGPAGVPAARIVGSLADIHPRKELEERLREGATHDTVTGLPNRRLFLDRLGGAVAQCRRSGTPFAVLFLDLDGFKVVNDSLGHLVGDHLLVEVGHRLESQLRDVDTAARFGGDEFAVLLNDIDIGDILPTASRLLEALHAPARIDGHELVTGASMGIATSAVGYNNPLDVLRDADTAMYAAKGNERGSLEFFDVEMHARATYRLALHQGLRRALENEEFVLHYQPIVSLPTREVTGFEALVRWRHPERGLLLPDEFLRVLEETGLIVRLGHWIIREACRQIAEWRDEHHRAVSVSVNVSDREFWHAGLLPHIRACLSEYDIPGEQLTLEITEGVIMHRPEVAQRILGEMRRAGLRLHIDDFGTGQSSLQTLHRYPVEALKIDQSFIHDLKSGEHGRDIVTVIVALGHALGLEVVAEGVETLEQFEFLREAGCHSAQGFLFTEAVPGAMAGKMIEQPMRDAG